MDRYYANNGFQKPAYVEKYTSGFRKRQQLTSKKTTELTRSPICQL